MATLDDLQQVFRRVFDTPDLVIAPTTTVDDVDGWDSLSHVTLIVTLEQRFRVRLGTKALLAMKNVGDLLREIQRNEHL